MILKEKKIAGNKMPVSEQESHYIKTRYKSISDHLNRVLFYSIALWMRSYLKSVTVFQTYTMLIVGISLVKFINII